MVKGPPAYLKSFVLVLLIVPEFRVEDTTAQVNEIKSLTLTGPWGSRVQEIEINYKEKSGHSYCNRQHR